MTEYQILYRRNLTSLLVARAGNDVATFGLAAMLGALTIKEQS